MDATKTKRFVLIVEDDTVLAEHWKAKLDAIGYEVIICSQIESALETCENHWPDVIVLDGFFVDEHGIPKVEGAVLFCSTISTHANRYGKRMPSIIGVTGVRPVEDLPTDVFSPIPLEVMPTRMRKPFAAEALVYEVERAFA